MSTQAERPGMLAVAVACGVVAISPFTIMPLLVGGMVADLELTLKQAGYVAAAEMTGSGLAAFVTSFFVARLNRRFAVVVALGVFVVGNFVAVWVTHPEVLLLTRFLVGTSSGITVAIVSAIFAGTRTPERNFSFLFMGNLAFGMVSFLIIPPLVLTFWGLPGVYCLLGIVAAAVMVFLPNLPKAQVVTNRNESPYIPVIAVPVLSGLAGMLVYFSAIGAFWPFVEQIGVAWGLARNSIGVVLSGTQLSGICGALLAAMLATKYGQRKPMVTGTLVSLAGMALFIFGAELWVYALASILFYFAFIFTLTYMVGVLAVLDRTGRIAALGVTMQTAGLAMGPAIAGEILSRGDYSGLIRFAALCQVLSLFFMLNTTRDVRTVPDG